MTSLEKIYQYIDENESFVLQGGAGSGKTESLKQTLQYISQKYPDKKIACITHTNAAVNEIKERVGDEFEISTIHSFLNKLVKDYKKNIHQIIFELFKLKHIKRLELEDYEDEKEQKKKEYDKYKKIYKKYESKLFTVKKQSRDKVIGKREYDKKPIEFNNELNQEIDKLNLWMQKEIKEKKDYNQIEYNNTQFDNYNLLTYGHDGLLKISFLLFKKYSKLKKILQDKYDYIFIDEYQDTNANIIDIFINNNIGLFGDAMQAIYEDGIGDVQKYIDSFKLKEVLKEDNYRCSYDVVNFINTLRDDDLVQQVALKEGETKKDREGEFRFCYAIYNNKPNIFSSKEDKNRYLNKLNEIIEIVNDKEYKTLMLTNKAVAKEVGFENLYNIFDARYREPKEYIDKVLKILQLEELCELCDAYEKKNYNFILTKLKQNGFSIKNINDKKKINKIINEVITSQSGAIETVKTAFTNKLIQKAEKFDEYEEGKQVSLQYIAKNPHLKKFKDHYNQGQHTYLKMKKFITHLEKEVFYEYEKEIKKEIFYEDLFSNKIKFSEVLNYFKYLNEETDYITMHKTKGSSIDNVMVVLDEYFWNEYDFKILYDNESNKAMKKKMQKLFYVACSRTKTNLCCVRLITKEEEAILLNWIESATKIDLSGE
jgi:DNA helicase-2/ATP-dependent DNA helicase PcrA